MPRTVCCCTLLGLTLAAQAPSFTLAEDNIGELVSKKISAAYQDVTLLNLVDRIRGEMKIPIYVDQRELAKLNGDWRDKRLSLHAANISLHRLMREVGESVGLTMILRHDAAVVTTQAAANTYRSARVYRVTRPIPVDRRLASITSTVQPLSWVTRGGDAEAAAVPATHFVVWHHALAHRSIAQRFAKSVVEVHAAPRVIPDHAQLAAKLAASGQINFPATTLKAITAQISEQYQIPIMVDVPALQALSIPPDQKIPKLSVGEIPRLASALDLLLHHIDPRLVWVVDQSVIITSVSAAAEKYVTRTYDLASLYANDSQDLIARLVEAIEYTVDSRSWLSWGGDGEIEVVDQSRLKVRQNLLVHQELSRMIGCLLYQAAD